MPEMLTKDGSAVVLDPQGKQHLVGVLEAERLFKQGWQPQTREGYLAGARGEVFGGAGEQVLTGLKGAVRGFTGGLSDTMFAGLGGDDTRHAEALRRGENPGSALAGELVGAVGQGLATGGGLGSLAAKGAAKLGAQKIGTKAATLAGLGAEGGLYAGSMAATEEDRGLQAQDDATAQMLKGAGIGVGVGASAMVLGKLLRFAGDRVRKNYKEVRIDLDDAAATSAEATALKREIDGLTGPQRPVGYPSGQTGPFPQPGMTGPMPAVPGPSGTGPFPQQVLARGGDPLADTAPLGAMGDPTAAMPVGQAAGVARVPPEAGWTGANQAIDNLAMQQAMQARALGYPPSRGWTGAGQAIEDLGPPARAGVIDQTTGAVPAMPSGRVEFNPLRAQVPPSAGWTGAPQAIDDATARVPAMDRGVPAGGIDDATANLRAGRARPGGGTTPMSTPMDEVDGLPTGRTGPFEADVSDLPPIGGATANIRGGRALPGQMPSGQTGPFQQMADQVGGRAAAKAAREMSEGLPAPAAREAAAAKGVRRKLMRKQKLDERNAGHRVRLVRRAAEREMGRRMGGIFGFDSAYRGAGAAAGYYAGGFFPAALGFMVAPKVIDGIVIAAERGTMALANPRVQKALARYLEPTIRKSALLGLADYHELEKDLTELTPAQASDAVTLALPSGTPAEIGQKLAQDAVKQLAFIKSVLPQPPPGGDPYKRFDPDADQLEKAGRKVAVAVDPERPVRLFFRGELDTDSMSAFRELYPDETRDWMNLLDLVVQKMQQTGTRPDAAMQRQIATVMDDQSYAPSIDDPAVQLYLADSFEEAMEGGVRKGRPGSFEQSAAHKTRLDKATEEMS